MKDRITILTGHVIDKLRELPEKSVHCVVTSPPYWSLRDYKLPPQIWGGDPQCEHEWNSHGRTIEHPDRSTGGKDFKGSGKFIEERAVQGSKIARGESMALGDSCSKCGAWKGQHGLEPTPELYVAHEVLVFREVWRVLREDGTLWVNLGDSYSSGGRKSRDPGKSKLHRAFEGENYVDDLRPDDPPGIKPKELVGIPWRVAFALQADGWYLRSDIVWHKPNPMPESVRDRPTKAHEYLFLLAKGKWVTRVIQVSDIAGEIVHFGKHIGSKEPLMRESFSKFCVRLATSIFDRTQRQHDFSLPPFYAEEWKQLFYSGDGKLIGDHPVEGRLTAICALFLNANFSTKGFLEELNRFWLNLSTSDTLLIRRIQSSLGTPAIHIDADGSIAVHDAGEICKFDFLHNKIVMQSTTTCKYFYDFEAIVEPVSEVFANDSRHKTGSNSHNDKLGYEDHGAQNPKGPHRMFGPMKTPAGWDTSTGRGSHGNYHKQGREKGKAKHSDSPERVAATNLLRNVDEARARGGAHDAPFGMTRNRRTVWTVPTAPFKEAHFATFPPDLIRPCIRAGCPVDGIVLDPFGGSGTTAMVAIEEGRKAILIELNEDYIELARDRTNVTPGLALA